MAKDVNINIKADGSQVDKAVSKVNSSLDRLSKDTAKTGANMSAGFSKGLVGLTAVVAGVAVVGATIKASLGSFASLEQNLGGAQAVFEQYADTVIAKSKESAGVMGTSTNQYLQIANRMGSLFQGTGATVANSMAMTTQAMQRATDVASVMGVDVGMALESVAGMAKGNFTMMDNLGVAMNDTNIEAYLLAKGIDASVSSMTTAEKVGYAYQMFMDRTAKYAGNFARESNTLQGSLDIMKATLGNVSAQLGSAFAPTVLAVAGFITNVLAPAFLAIIPYVQAFMQVIGTAVNFVLSALGSVFGVGGQKDAKALATNVNGVAKAATGAGASAGAIGDGLKGAGKEAKKLNEQLSGFDEMNVLKEQEPASGGGGGGGGGGAGMGDIAMPDLTGLGKQNTSVLDGMKKVMDGIMNSPFVKGFLLVWESVGKALKFVVDLVASLIPQPVKDFFNTIMGGEGASGILSAVAFALGILAGALALGAVALGIWNVVVAIATGVTGAFTAVMAVLTSPITLIIAGIALLITGIVLLVQNWETVKTVTVAVWNTIVDAVKSAFKWIMDIISPIANWINDTLVQPVVKFFTAIWDVVSAVFGKIFEIFGKLIEIYIVLLVAGFKLIWETIVKVFTPVVEFFRGVWDGVVKIFTPVVEWFSGIFSGAWEAIKKVFGAVGGFFRGVWDTIAGIFGSIGTAIGNAVSGAFKGVVNGILGFVENFVNVPVKAINTLIDVINKVPGVNVGKLSTLSLPRMAKGGVVNRATMAIIGEAGSEAVVPLENNTGWVDKMASMLAEKGGAGGGAPSTIIVKLGEETIFKKVIDGINERSQMSGQNEIIV